MQYYSQNIEKPMLRATTNSEKGSVAKIKVPKRTVHLHIALPEQQPFKVQFLTKDDKSVSTSVVQLGEDKTYTPDMVFQPNTTYLFRLNTTFEGEIVIDQVCDKTMSIPIIASKEPFSLMMGYDEKPKNPYIDKPFIRYKAPEDESEIIILEIGQKYFQGMKDGVYVVNGTLKPYVQKFIDDEIVSSVVLGVVADSSQAYADVRKSFWDLARGLRYEIKVINSKRYIILKGWRHLRTYFVGTKYSTSNPKLAGLDPKSLKHVTSVKNLMGSNIVTVIIGSLLTTIHYFLSTDEDKRDLSDLLTAVFTGVAKTLLAAFVAAIIVAGIILLSAILFEVAIASATLIIGTTIVLGIAGSAGLNYFDSSYGWTANLQEKVNESQAWIENEYKQFRRSMALFSDLISGETKPMSEYNGYLK